MKFTRRKRFVHYLPIIGCAAAGMTYVGIGVIALLSFFKVREGGADETSMLVVLNDILAGKIVVIIILTGTLSYVLWRIYESITDPYQYGNDYKGLAKRAGIAFSAVPDLLIVYAGIRVLTGITKIQANGQPLEERAFVQTLLNNGQSWIVMAIGCVTVGTAVIQLIYGITKGYKERVSDHSFSIVKRSFFNGLGLAGYTARAIILGIIGYFFFYAGVTRDSEAVVNTDKAFDFIGDNVGHFFFIVLAVGTICYGLFMFAMGATYKQGRHR